jgi:signal transduction histidine kinase
MFHEFLSLGREELTQRCQAKVASEDKSGLGLGLSISRRSVEANDGILRVRNKA